MTTRIIEPPHGLRAAAAAFAVALFAGLGASSSFAQGYYPPSNSPIDGNPNLQAIEAKLTGGATLVVPAPVGKHVALDAEISAALGAAVADELDGTPIGGGVDLGGLVGEISKYRPAKTGTWTTAAVAKVLAESATANIPGDLETVTTAAVTPNPKGAPGVVKSAIKLIAVPTSSGPVDLTADDIVGDAVAAAAAYTNKIVASAMGSAKKINAADLSNVEQDIVSQAVQESVAAGASYLIDETMAAAEKGRATTVDAGAIAAAAFQFRSGGPATGLALNNLTAGLVTGGAIRGAGVTQIASIVAGVNGATSNSFSAYVTQVGNAYQTASVSTDPVVSSGAVLASINAGNVNLLPATLQGAVAFLNREDTLLLGGAGGALKKNESLGGTSSVADIVEAVVAGVQKDVKKIAVSAISAVDATITLHDIGQGAAKGADVSLIGATAGAMVKGTTINQLNVEGIVSGLIDGAVATGKNGAIGDVAQLATKASKLGSIVVVKAVTTGPAGDAYRAVAGAVAGDKKNAATIKTAGLGARGDDDDVANGLAADTVMDIQLSPKTFFNSVTTRLTSASNTALIDTQAILTGAGLANPNGAIADVAAAIALTGFNTDALIDAATQTSRKKAFDIQLSAAAAIHAKAGTSDLFDYVNHTTFDNPKFAADIATGATVAAPQYAHIIGHAAAFAAPQTAGKMVPALFAYSQLDNHLAPNIQNRVAAAAAISAGVTCGVLEANSPKELSYIKSAVSAAVKAAAALSGNGNEGTNGFRQSDGTAGGFTSVTQVGAAGVVTGYISESVNVGQTDIPGGSGGIVAAVITAAVKADKKDVLAIAQAAATAAATISGAPGAYVGTALIAALSAAGAKVPSASAIQNAVNFGIAEAVAGRVGAGAAGVLNYTHFNCTGSPVTSIFNL